MDSIFVGTELLSDGSILGFLQPSPQVKKEFPSLPKKIVIRVIDYYVKDHVTVRLYTSLLDHKKFSARQLAELYHARWDIELGFDEFKTDILMREESLRSRSVDGVTQELWASLVMYNLVRRQMAIAAREHGVPANTMSFKASLVLVQNFFFSNAENPSIGLLPKRLQELMDEIWRFRLPPRRSERSFRRQVKIKMSNYPKAAPPRRETASGA